MHYLSVYCRFRDEKRYLREWLEYHLLQGVEHFYLFDHLSIDNPLAVLQPYINKGVVTYTYFSEELASPHSATFAKMGNQALALALGKTRWLAIIDSDEFLVPAEGVALVDFLRRHQRHPAIVVNWQMFGTAGVEQIPADKLLLEVLTQRAPRDYGQNKHVKTILQPALTTDVDIHHANYPAGTYAVNTDRQPVVGAFSMPIHTDRLRLHHYFMRDRNFVREVKIPRRAKFGHDASEIWHWDEDMNQEKDTTMLKYVAVLRPRVLAPQWERYLTANPDLVAAGITTEAGALDHWFTLGREEGRALL